MELKHSNTKTCINLQLNFNYTVVLQPHIFQFQIHHISHVEQHILDEDLCLMLTFQKQADGQTNKLIHKVFLNSCYQHRETSGLNKTDRLF